MRERALDVAIGALDRSTTFFWDIVKAMHPVLTRLQWTRFQAYRLEKRPDDVYIVTYPKSGTTWVQMMAWQLQSNGSLDFRHIDDVVPWIERCTARDLARLAALPSPRFFKTHLPYRDVPAGARYIYVVRRLRDVAVSYYHHYRLMEDFTGGVDAFAKHVLAGKVGGGSWSDHVRPWVARRNDPDVLFLSYEEMKADPAGALRRIARFSGVALAESDIPRLIEQSSVAFMKKLDARFDPRLARRGSFVRKGEVDDAARALDPALLAALADEEERVLGRRRGGRVRDAGGPPKVPSEA